MRSTRVAESTAMLLGTGRDKLELSVLRGENAWEFSRKTSQLLRWKSPPGLEAKQQRFFSTDPAMLPSGCHVVVTQ